MPPVGAQNVDNRRGRCPLIIASELDNMESHTCGSRLGKQAQYTKLKNFVERKSGARDIPPSRNAIDIVHDF